jgi:hypothetical protein
MHYIFIFVISLLIYILSQEKKNSKEKVEKNVLIKMRICVICQLIYLL